MGKTDIGCTRPQFIHSVIGIDDETPLSIGVATTDGRAYYQITHLLRKTGLPFISLTPGDRVPTDVKLVVTTLRERELVRGRTVLCYEELGENPSVAKGRIISHLQGGDDTLLIGLDPGERIGWAAYYRQRGLGGGVLNSPDAVVSAVKRLVTETPAGKKIIRVGEGNRRQALSIASMLSRSLKGDALIELVDERGTSSTVKWGRRRTGARDQLSASLIALRQGRQYIAR